jgi:hypothetical protein
MRGLAASAFVIAAAVGVLAQDIPLEYRVKAAYLLNFARFVEWAPPADASPLTICVASPSPFGPVLDQTVAGERVSGRPVTARTIMAPSDDCSVLFVPEAAAAAPYLRAVQGRPVLTVGETRDFIARGGIIGFLREGNNIRFAIDNDTAERANLRISSRLLRLGRMP